MYILIEYDFISIQRLSKRWIGSKQFMCPYINCGSYNYFD